MKQQEKVEEIPSNTAITQKEKEMELERQKCEFRWERNIKMINDKLGELDLSSFSLKGLNEELQNLFDTCGTVKGHHIVDKDTPVQLINGVDIANLKLGELMIFIKKRANTEKFAGTGFNFQTLSIEKFNENPFLHPLAKALGITKMDDKWLENHSFLTVENYDRLNKGEIIGEATGFWNTTIEKAIVDLKDYTKVKKLVYQNGKAIVVSLYVTEFTPIVEAII